MYNFHPASQPASQPANQPASQPANATLAHADAPCARLNWLTRWDAEAERHAHLFRNAREEEQVRLMRRPVATREAFARFGLLLGAFVPAALFYRMFNYGIDPNGQKLLMPLLLLAMNVTCCLMGRKMGAVCGGRMDDYERTTWHRMCVCAAGLGALWALTTGASGGVLFFGIGAPFGAAIALPFGTLGFLVFAVLHRLMARGGMIDARHVWPLAFGVVLTITALILSPTH